MIKAIKMGIAIYLVIMISYATGVNHERTDANYTLPDFEEPITPNLGDTARHYRQIFTRPGIRYPEVNVND